MAVILQHNLGRRADAVVALMETAKEQKADVVLVQEPPALDGSKQPAFEFLRAGGVLTARRIDSEWTISTQNSFPRDTDGDVQALALGRRGHRGREARLVNVYQQGTGRQHRARNAEDARWDEILLEDCIVVGGFNALSPVWIPRRTQRRDAKFLEDLIATHELAVKNDDQVRSPIVNATALSTSPWQHQRQPHSARDGKFWMRRKPQGRTTW